MRGSLVFLISDLENDKLYALLIPPSSPYLPLSHSQTEKRRRGRSTGLGEKFLIIILIRLIIHHIEEAQLVNALARADDAQPIAQLLLLEEFLRPRIHTRRTCQPPISPQKNPPPTPYRTVPYRNP